MGKIRKEVDEVEVEGFVAGKLGAERGHDGAERRTERSGSGAGTER